MQTTQKFYTGLERTAAVEHFDTSLSLMRKQSIAYSKAAARAKQAPKNGSV